MEIVGKVAGRVQQRESAELDEWTDFLRGDLWGKKKAICVHKGKKSKQNLCPEKAYLNRTKKMNEQKKMSNISHISLNH